MIPAAAARPGQGSWNVLELVRWTTGRFAERGLPSPRLDAELLTAHALGVSRHDLYVRFDRVLDAEELTALRELVRRRQTGEPVAYLTGRKEFWDLTLLVDPRVLIPRPETEVLLEEALDRLPHERATRIADVGTGSGALALALARARPAAQIFATDVSRDALSVARQNAERLGLTGITFLEGHLAAPLVPHAPFDLVCANLPYIPTAELEALPAEVCCEPRVALDGGPHGLELLRDLADQAIGLLLPGGALAAEVGAGQADAVAGFFTAAGFEDPVRRRDLAGIERVLAAPRPVVR